MIELLRSNDMVLFSCLSALLTEAGVDFMIADEFTSAVEGSIGAIPRRLLVNAEQISVAQEIFANLSLTIKA